MKVYYQFICSDSLWYIKLRTSHQSNSFLLSKRIDPIKSNEGMNITSQALAFNSIKDAMEHLKKEYSDDSITLVDDSPANKSLFKRIMMSYGFVS